MTERRIRSIPPKTMFTVLREQGRGKGSGRIGGFGAGSLGRSEPNPGGFDIERHIFNKPTGERSTRPLIAPEDEGITMKEVEEQKDYDNHGSLGLVLQFSGISFTSTALFERSKHDYGPDSSVFYAPVEYKSGRAFLIFSTLVDIFEIQVVSRTKDVNPIFRYEKYLPDLATIYKPQSMIVNQTNGIVTVSYETRDIADN